MRRATPDPLANLPSADVLRRKLAETERAAARLRAALELVERVEAAGADDNRGSGADHAR